MKKRILSMLLAITLVMSCFTCLSAVSAESSGSENLEGWLDSVQAGENSVTVRGWAFDWVDTSRFSQIHIYIGGNSTSATAEGHVILANTSRPDVDDAYGCGDNHGFDATIATEKIGEQFVYVYAISVDEQSHIYLGARAVTIGGKDTKKPDITNARVPVSHSDRFVVSCTATDKNLDRVEVCVWYTSDKENTQTKYDARLSDYYANCEVYLKDIGGKNGNYTIQITAYDTSENYDVEEFTFDFYNPVGLMQELVDNGNSIKISGWAFDESDTSKSIDIKVYIGGKAGEGELTTITADKPHAEADKLYGCGANHGFEAVIPTTKTGNQAVYIYMENIGSGGNTLLCEFWVNISKEYEKPAVKSFTAQTGSHSHECVLTAEISDNIGVNEVIFEAWNESDPTADPIWCYGTIQDGVATGTLNLNSLSEDNGRFILQVRAYDYGTNYDIAQIKYDLYVPKGKVEVLKGIEGGFKLEGWAFDGNNTDASIEIAVYIGGGVNTSKEQHTLVADKSRADIDEAFGCGENHGFSKVIKTDFRGDDIIFIYAKNIDNGTDALIYVGTVNIAEPKYEEGDVNLDGTVDVNDVTYMQMHLAGYKNSDGSAFIDIEDDNMFIVANVNDDDYVDISDATQIQMMLAGYVV